MKPYKLPRWFFLIFLAVILLLVVGGTWFFIAQRELLQKNAENNLLTIAQSKVDQIASWRRNQVAEGRELMTSLFFIQGVADWLESGNPENTQMILARFKSLQDHYGYFDVLLVSPQGQPLLSLNNDLAPLDIETSNTLKEAMASGESMLTDLHIDEKVQSPHICVIAPLIIRLDGKQTQLGAVILINDARDFLYPLIQSWPTPSKTAETLLFERDGDEVLFLNDLRHQADTALKMRISLSETNVPAVKVVLGEKGIVTGLDYRGVEVLSALMPVPDSPWFIVAKVDTAEALAVWRTSATLIVALLLGFIGTIAGTAVVFWQRDEKRHYFNLAAAKDAHRESEERFRKLYEQSPGPYQSLDIKGNIIDVNNAWLAELGYEREEVIGKLFWNFLVDDQKPLFEEHFQKFKAEGKTNACDFDLKHKDGSLITVSFDGRVGYDEKGNFLRTHCIFTNITERKKVEKELLRRTEQISIINEMGQALAQTMDLDGIFHLAYHFLGELADRPNFGISLVNFSNQTLAAAFLNSDGNEMDISQLPPLPINHKKITGRSGAINSAKPVIIDDLEAEIANAKTAVIVGSNVHPKSALYVPMVVDGKVIGLLEVQSYKKAAYDTEKAELLGTAANAIGLAIANSRLFQNLKLQSTALDAAANAIVITDLDGTIEWVNPAFCELTGYPVEECLGRNPRELVRWGLTKVSVYKELWDTILAGNVWRGTLINQRKDGSLYTEEQTITPMKNERGEIIQFIGIKQDVTERDQRERELEVIFNISAALRTVATREEMLPVLLEQMLKQLKIEGATMEILNPANGELKVELGCGVWAPMTGKIIPAGKGLCAQVLKTRKPYLNNKVDGDSDIFMPELFAGCHAAACAPLKVQDQIIGLLWIGSKRVLDDKDIRLLSSVADIAANAIHRTSLYEQTLNKVRQLDTLRTIDQTINSSLDLRVTLGVIVKQAPQIIPIDALAVLIYNKRTLNLDYAAGSGFRSKAIAESSVRIGRGLAGKAALERRMMSVTDLQGSPDVFTRKALVEKEGFNSYHAAPLIVKGKIQGVLEVFHRTPFKPDEEWLEVLGALATQTAIAIDNSAMFTDLQRSNFNLTQAYDETIEGWAKALELRDLETEGHARRVTDKTLVLARAMRIKDEEIVFLTRGALLHDIGKMAILDEVLNKPGALSDEEWEMMRAHPKIAYDLLYPIKYLRSALDIPYCHHEKWDGSGYPRGLKGEEIPLSARLFAVVDVYDALTSDRPYRKAWETEKALAYIREQSGHHFDPRAVELFIKSNKS